ncbi:MAG: nucleoside hydrolase [Anaerolineae bacterium]
MRFPTLTDAERLARLELPAGTLRMVLDTDTYNEIDDQFAVVYSLLSPERLAVEAIYAAPFSNRRAAAPAEGMEKSYQEILRLLERLGRSPEGLVHRGSTAYLPGPETPVRSAAAEDLVQRALAEPDPLYVVAIGAITNVASAILIEPEIIKHMVIVWLGGHALHWGNTREFNLMQDVPASRLVFDCGVPLVHIPCKGVTTHLRTTISELERYVKGAGAIGDYLVHIFSTYEESAYGMAWSKEIWDVATIAYLLNQTWVPTDIVHSPIVTDQLTWSFDNSRHLIRSARYIDRDPIFRDLFTKLRAQAEHTPPRPTRLSQSGA